MDRGRGVHTEQGDGYFMLRRKYSPRGAVEVALTFPTAGPVSSARISSSPSSFSSSLGAIEKLSSEQWYVRGERSKEEIAGVV